MYTLFKVSIFTYQGKELRVCKEMEGGMEFFKCFKKKLFLKEKDHR